MTKFASNADEFVWEITMNGGCDDEVGESDAGGWYGSVWFAPSDQPYLVALGIDAGYAIVREDSSGFVYVDYYQFHKDWEDAWGRILLAHREDDCGAGADDYTYVNER